MSQVEAVYQGGVFRPLEDVKLEENQRVRLEVQPIGPPSVEVWLEEVSRLHEQILSRRGVLPDSTPLIAEDRLLGGRRGLHRASGGRGRAQIERTPWQT